MVLLNELYRADGYDVDMVVDECVESTKMRKVSERGTLSCQITYFTLKLI